MKTLWIGSVIAALVVPMGAAAAKLEKMSCLELRNEVLLSGDEDDRADAAELLGEKGCTDAIEDLARVCAEDADNEVCKTAVGALAELGTGEALDALQGVLSHDDIDDGCRKKALNKLFSDAPERVDGLVHEVLGTYRSLDQGFSIRLLEVLVARDLRAYGDLTILMVTDRTLKTKLRKKALKAAEDFGHPLLHDAYISLLDDKDKKLRIEACNGLARSGMPSSVVAPALEQVVRTDDKGDVRAAALKALKLHAHKGLLPLIHTEVVSEMHMIAWYHAVELLIAVGDESSLDTIHQVLLRDDNLTDEGVIALIHMLVRIGDPSSIHALASLEARVTGTVDREAVIAREYLESGQATGGAYEPPMTDVVLWDEGSPDPNLPTLSVQLDGNGVVIWVAD
jgi:HEAT repeat protein